MHFTFGGLESHSLIHTSSVLWRAIIYCPVKTFAVRIMATQHHTTLSNDIRLAEVLGTVIIFNIKEKDGDQHFSHPHSMLFL